MKRGWLLASLCERPKSIYNTERMVASRDKRRQRDLHALNDDGMVLCNPRDKEAAHRAEMEGIATADRRAVTCRKYLSLLSKGGKDWRRGR
jgi:hypothetical protein